VWRLSSFILDGLISGALAFDADVYADVDDTTADGAIAAAACAGASVPMRQVAEKITVQRAAAMLLRMLTGL
jgi:hypothetical protein